MNIALFLWPLLFAFLLSFILTFIVRRIAIKKHWFAAVRDRDVHKTPVPRLGGVGIFGAFFITVLAVLLFGQKEFSSFGFPFAVLGLSIDKRLLAVLVAALILTIAMVIDDVKGMKAYHKLIIQVLAALVVIAGGVGLTYINNPFGGPEIRLDAWQIPITIGSAVYHFVPLADLLAVIWLVFLMNVLNFSDGIDGLAGSTSAVALAVLGLLSLTAAVSQSSTAMLACIGVGSTLGFLVWNVPPARMFMGDSGSMFLGFLIGVLAIISGGKLAATLVVLVVPVMDALWVILNRIVSGKNPFTTPDQSHLHHKFLKAGFGVVQTLVTFIGISMLFGAAALQKTGIDKLRSFIVAMVIIVLVMITIESLGRRQKV